MRQSAVYILASGRNGTLYLGATTDLRKRIWQHREGLVDGFTSKYRVHRLVWYQLCDSLEGAFATELRMKAWKRAWKVQLIEETNPNWRDLYRELD